MEIFLVWAVLSILVAAFADSRGRSAFGYLLLALVLSPLLGFIILLVTPNLKARAQEEAARAREEENRAAERQRVHEREIVALKAVVEAPPRASGAAATAAPAAGRSVADELERLAALMERGLLTQAEFDSQKSQLLGSR